MAREFKSANLYEIQDIVSTYPFSRQITEVHLHHTWRPRQSDYQGLATIEGMWRYHTETNGWSDIGQHVTVAPNGSIWLCRNFNWAPASARGFNGNSHAGPFMIEMIGDFDIDEEQLSSEQLKATLAVIKSVQNRFGLQAHALRFHNEMSSKTCPGSSSNKAQWIEQICAFELESHSCRSADTPFPRRATRAYELMRGMNPDAVQADDMSDAEHDGNADLPDSASRGTHRGSRELTIDILEELSAHTINLERGQFSDSGRMETTQQDVDRLFEELLPLEIQSAVADNRRAQLLFYAHGGLVSEKNALLGAIKQLPFWRANGVYPVFFIWETGFAETVRQLVEEAMTRSRAPDTRGVLDWLTDNVTDRVIEEISSAAGGRLIWGGMKSSAELASDSGNGADYVAGKLADLLGDHADRMDVHAVGHSAGSIFHAHFLPLLAARNAPIKTVHYLAPAVRNDLFKQNIAPLLGNGIGSLTLFTMNKQREKADTVASVYRKSLLYLVSRALEDADDTDILGLEESLRRDLETRRLFGLDGSSSELAEVVWSPTSDSQSGNASTALTHGGFDDDVHTMESVLRRMLGLRNGEQIEPFPDDGTRSFTNFWNDQFDWPEHLEHLSRLDPADAFSSDNAALPPSEKPDGPGLQSAPASVAPQSRPEPVQGNPEKGNKPEKSKADRKKDKKKKKKSKQQHKQAKKTKAGAADTWAGNSDERDEQTPSPNKPPPAPEPVMGDGRRIALCIGIDKYQRSPLAGCVADAKLWKKTLSGMGYQVTMLKNEQATANRIRECVADLINSSRPGDHLVLQFAGHGTQFKDIDGDEAQGDSPALDECLCAVDCDFANDGLIIDDELRVLIEGLPDRVTMTCFFDCCHSGSATRMALMMANASTAQGVRSRFLPPSKHMKKVYRKRIEKVRQSASRAPGKQRDVLFSACRSTELAYESNGQGDFTRMATKILAEGIQGLSNTDFLQRVLLAFGSTPRQTPEIHCDATALSRSFLELHSNSGASSANSNLTAASQELEYPVDE
ncbi:caspase family protein [Granulosicoccus sp. 3-233]|uniref:caspase family protein n=1 Tax=Granulosicoccus sp. 3-233 TaxID=3417969 RepID=UPI003D34BC8A